jgi:hypothetical protein
MSHPPRIVLRPNPNIPIEQVRDARARAWAFVFQCWHARKGEQHDLTDDSIRKWSTRQDKKGIQNADLHGD